MSPKKTELPRIMHGLARNQADQFKQLSTAEARVEWFAEQAGATRGAVQEALKNSEYLTGLVNGNGSVPDLSGVRVIDRPSEPEDERLFKKGIKLA